MINVTLNNDEMMVWHSNNRNLKILIQQTTNSIKVECGRAHMTIADYETNTHKHGGPVYFFNGKPTDRDGKLQNTEYFEDMKKGLAEKALELEQEED